MYGHLLLRSFLRANLPSDYQLLNSVHSLVSKRRPVSGLRKRIKITTCRLPAALVAALLLVAATGCGGGGSVNPPANQNNESASPPPPVQHVSTTVATYHNNNARTGANLTESTLNSNNVNVLSFGRLAAIPLTGEVYAQPLYIPNVAINGAKQNLVIVATEHDQVYAIDPNSQTIVWNRDFLGSDGTITSVPAVDLGCDDVAPEIGITGTPVIDASSNTIYVVVRTKEMQDGTANYYQRLHALDLITGQDKLPPTTITTPAGQDGQFGTSQFDPLWNNQRSALLLVNGQIYVTWASHCDYGIYRGWLMAFDETTLQLTAAWTPTPSGYKGGIWMGSEGPAADSNGEVYVAVGNGYSDAMMGGSNYGNSLVRIHPSGSQLTVTDYFIPYNFQLMDDLDLDFGSGGPVLLPARTGAIHKNLLVVAGKIGTVYLLDRDGLGHWQTGNDAEIVQSFPTGYGGACSNAAFWGNKLYFAFPHGPLVGYAYDATAPAISTSPFSTSKSIVMTNPGVPSVSSNGTVDGIVWLLQSDNHDNGADEVLRAFSVYDLSQELYDSEMSPQRDHAGAGVKFTTPTVADGLVFVGTQSELDIYGLLSK